MNDFQRKRALEMVVELKKAGLNSGLLVIEGNGVVLRSPGSPYVDAPTLFSEEDLSNAVELRLLEKSRVTGSFEWEWYTIKS